MMTSDSIKRAGARAAVLAVAIAYVPLSVADEMTSFATGGYARGLRTMVMMHKIDTNGDGMVSQDEWSAFQDKVFGMLDNDKSGMLDDKEFVSAGSDELASFATGGFSRGLRTKEMLKKIDTDGDGTISKDEWRGFQDKVFGMMNTDPAHKGMLDQNQFFGRGSTNK